MSLEDPFWTAFVQIAQDEDIPINELAAKIDAVRLVDAGLASAIRVFVLAWYQKGAS